MGVGSQLIAALIGEPFELPPELLRRYPELGDARYRRGGLPVRIGGWALGSSTAAGITLRRIVFLAPRTPHSAAVLMHSLCHVHPFFLNWGFPVHYLWQSLRYVYYPN